MKTNLPHGWEYEAVFGLGQGATAGPLHLAIGLTALLIAAALAMARLRGVAIAGQYAMHSLRAHAWRGRRSWTPR